MAINFFLIIIILVSLLFLVSILISKFTILSKIKIERILKEKEKKTKTGILQKRFINNIKNSALRNKTIDFFNKRILNLKNKFNNLEIRYKEKFNQLIKESPVEIEGRIEKLLNEGNQFLNKDKLNEAEQKFIEVMAFNPRNLVALKSLFKIYLTQNKLLEAKKMGEYILQINKQSLKWWLKFNKVKASAPESLISELFLSIVNLGDLCFKLGKIDEAIKYYKIALSYHPNNPRILDFLIENSIILGKKDEATNYLMRIKESNFENQKILEWEEKIKNLANN